MAKAILMLLRKACKTHTTKQNSITQVLLACYLTKLGNMHGRHTNGIQEVPCCRPQYGLWEFCHVLQASPKPGWHEQEQLTMPMQEDI